MAKATTKIELLKAANDNFEKMWKIIDSLSKDQQEQNFTFNKAELSKKDGAAHWQRDNNIRDVLIHLYEWHQLLLKWVESNAKGDEKPFLPHGITWTNYQQINKEFFDKHQDTAYSKSRQMVADSHSQVIALIDGYNDTELFQKKHFAWTGTTSLAQYCHSATVAHYDWAMKKLKAYKQQISQGS